jgi:hypothetical protein
MGERLAVLPRLDCLSQPDALLVLGDVLDLVGDGAAVRLDEPRQRVRERFAGNVEAKHARGDSGL